MMLACLTLALAAGGVRHIDASLDLARELLDYQFVDVDADGKLDLVLGMRARGGERELLFHRIVGVRVELEPFARVPVFRDVLAYGLADVRPEPGRELLFLTRSGVHSYSTTIEGLRGNVERLAKTELIYDVPDRRELPYWEYTLPSRRGDLVLLPRMTDMQLWVPKPTESREPGEAAYQLGSSIGTGYVSFQHSRERRNRGDGVSVEVEIDDDDELFYRDSFPPESLSKLSAFFGDSRAIRAPALADVNGDGWQDLLAWNPPRLSVYLSDGDGLPASPTWVEELPEYLNKPGQDLELSIADLDGDGDPDLLAKLSTDPDGFENAEYSLLPLIHVGQRMFPEQPDQILRFEAAVLRVDVVDVDGDGRPDLALRKFELPDLIETVKGLEFELTYLLYLGEAGTRPFGRKPVLKQTEKFDEDSVASAAANRSLRMDCDGDGVPDLVEVDLDGYVGIRRMKLESGFFSGEKWTLDKAPWKRFEVRGSIDSLQVLDLNGDGIGDIVSSGDETLAILLSMDPSAGGGRR